MYVAMRRSLETDWSTFPLESRTMFQSIWPPVTASSLAISAMTASY